MIPVLLAMLASAPPPPLDAVYDSARRYDRASFRFVPPSEIRLEKLRRLAADLVMALGPGEPPQALRDRAASEGLELSTARDAAGEVWVLREAGGRREGTGLYAFRPGGTRACVQAPHSFFDEGTGRIALTVFAGLRASCLAVNTVRRYALSASGEGLADAAHAERTAFRAVSQGVVGAAGWPVVQLHGFDRHEELGPSVAAVVSEGAAAPAPVAPARRLREALAKWLAPERVLLFGVDAHSLGATTNVVGADVRKAGATFLHVELSAAVRRRLIDRGAAPLTAALAEALEVKP